MMRQRNFKKAHSFHGHFLMVLKLGLTAWGCDNVLHTQLESRRSPTTLLANTPGRIVVPPDRDQRVQSELSWRAIRHTQCHSTRSYVSLHTTLNMYVRIIFPGVLSFLYSQRQIKGLVRLAATHILSHGGVVRGIQYWGTETLPQRMRSHGTNHDHGEYVLSSYVVPFKN